MSFVSSKALDQLDSSAPAHQLSYLDRNREWGPQGLTVRLLTFDYVYQLPQFVKAATPSR